jgi:large subunit ribosomal protein L31
MKADIHPKYYPNAKVTCGCGNVFYVGSTKPELRVDICSQCHPFYTGEQRMVDTAGQVERFMRRLERREELRAAPQSPPPAPAPAKARRKPGTKAAKAEKKPAPPEETSAQS